MVQAENSVGRQPIAGEGVPSDVDLLEPVTEHFFPFLRRLDFTPILEFWETLVRDEHGIDAEFAARMRGQMESVEGLLGPIDDLQSVWENMPIVSRLMSVVMPSGLWDTASVGAFVPFRSDPFLATPRFKALIPTGKSAYPSGHDSMVEDHSVILRAYLNVAAHFYGLQFDFQDPTIITVPDPATGLDRYFRLDSDDRFVRPVLVGPLPRLSDEEVQELRENVTDVARWRQNIPDGTFELHGVGLVSAVDITDQEILSRLTRNLIEGDANTAAERFVDVEQRVRERLRRPDIVILDDEGDLISDILNKGSGSDAESISSISGLTERREETDPTIVDRALLSARIQVVEDLAEAGPSSAMERKLLARGLRNLVVVPLLCDSQAIGTLNLASPNPSDLTVLTEIPLREVAPMFAMALRRSREEINNRMQALIRERYTAIHPAIEWRFRRAAHRMWIEESAGKTPEAEEIVFEEVYPLYSVSDLRGSSHQRNEAIRADLQDHLRLALEVVQAGIASRPSPALENISFRIERAMKQLDDGISSGDESTILEFLRREIEPLFDHLAEMNAEVTEQVIRYRAALDPALGMIYRRRKEFEESVAEMNRMISAYLEEEQAKAQAMCPHYFEKHQTDGVDFGMYVGASLLEDARFDLLYLKDLRLWQLLTVCGIARRAAAMKSGLRVPLDMAHLILVQDVPLSIRFRLDEKQFDVDGAYNVRYEIMKKRIDKALVKGSSERLTQPETIAIIYSNGREGTEYGEYIEYLQSLGHLHPQVESLELETLQEVQGLRALRVRVKTDSP